MIPVFGHLVRIKLVFVLTTQRGYRVCVCRMCSACMFVCSQQMSKHQEAPSKLNQTTEFRMTLK